MRMGFRQKLRRAPDRVAATQAAACREVNRSLRLGTQRGGLPLEETCRPAPWLARLTALLSVVNLHGTSPGLRGTCVLPGIKTRSLTGSPASGAARPVPAPLADGGPQNTVTGDH